jgi:hypothetical protein
MKNYARPFGLLVQDTIPFTARGYTLSPENPAYDPHTQTVPAFLIDQPQGSLDNPIYISLFNYNMTYISTYRSVYSTGVVNLDMDLATDDTGSD